MVLPEPLGPSRPRTSPRPISSDFFIPNYLTVVVVINFGRTGTTHIGKYILNHSFMMPGLIATGVSVGLGERCSIPSAPFPAAESDNPPRRFPDLVPAS